MHYFPSVFKWFFHIALAIFCSAVYASNANVLNIYNWSNYIGKDTIKNFEKETGIKVQYDIFDSDETLLTKMEAGHTGYDLVVPSSSFALLQIQGNLLQKIDKNQIPNWKNIDRSLLKKLRGVDPGNQYLVIWRWGYITVGINQQAVAKALGDLSMPSNAWSLVFDPKYAKRLSICGITLASSATKNVPLVLLYLGLNPESINQKDYEKASEILLKVRPYITNITSTGWVDALASNNTCVVVATSGDINIAREEAIKTKEKYTIKALTPQKGSTLFFDTMAIPKDAPHVKNALKFINYVLDPKVSAAITNEVLYAGPVKESMKYTKKTIDDNTTVFPSAKQLKSMHPPIVYTNKIRDLETKVWDRFILG